MSLVIETTESNINADNTWTGQNKFTKTLQAGKGADVASANNTTLGLDGNFYWLTGNVQLNAISSTGWQDGAEIVLRITGNPTIKNNFGGGGAFKTINLLGATDWAAISSQSYIGLKLDGGFWWEQWRRTSDSYPISVAYAQNCYGDTLLTGPHRESQGVDVASANDTTLGSDGNTFELTGNIELQRIVSTNWQNGSTINLLFSGIPNIKHGVASGGANITILLAGSVDALMTAGSRISLLLCEIGGVQAWREISRTFV